MEKKFFAFISYSHKDEEWAVWFQHELENYHLPSELGKRKKMPKDFRPVFRDSDELKSGNLERQINEALASSAYLVVICSPNSAQSTYVKAEIEEFIKLGHKKSGKTRKNSNIDKIFPFIVEGIPNSGDEKTECFPEPLRLLSKEQQRIGGNVNEGANVGQASREKAFVKVLAGMLPPEVKFPMLWNRYELDKIEKERKEREQKVRLQTAISCFVAEKATTLTKQGNSFLATAAILEMLRSGTGIMTPEVERSLRMSMNLRTGVIIHDATVECAVPLLDGERIATVAGTEVCVYLLKNGALLKRLPIQGSRPTHVPRMLVPIPDSDKLLFTHARGFYVIDLDKGADYKNSLGSWQIGDATVDGEPRLHLFHCVVVSADGSFALAATNIKGSGYGAFIHRIDLKDIGNATHLNTEILMDADTFPPLSHNTVRSLALSPDGNTLALALCSGAKVYLWSLPERACMLETECPNVSQIAYSNDGKLMLTVAEKGLLEIRLAENPKEVLKSAIHEVGSTKTAQFSPDGKWVLLGGKSSTKDQQGNLALCDISGQDVVVHHPFVNEDTINNLAMDASGRFLITASDDRTTKICSLSSLLTPDTREPVATSSVEKGYFVKMAFPDKGDSLFVALSDIKTEGSVLQLRDAASLAIRKEWYVPLNRFDFFSVNHEGSEIRTQDRYRYMCIVDIEQEKPMCFDVTYQTYFMDVVYGEKGLKYQLARQDDVFQNDRLVNKVYVLTGDGSAILTNIETSYSKRDYAFDKEGNLVALFSPIGQIVVARLCDGKAMAKLECPNAQWGSMCFSSDNKYLLGPKDNMTLGIWDTKKWKPLHDGFHFQRKHHGNRPSLDCSPDGEYLVGGFPDGDVVIWHILSGMVVDRFSIKCNYLMDVKFNPNPQRMSLTAIHDGTVDVYEWKTLDNLLDDALKTQTARTLSEEERKIFHL